MALAKNHHYTYNKMVLSRVQIVYFGNMFRYIHTTVKEPLERLPTKQEQIKGKVFALFFSS
jgi:hypothetical protein